MKQVKNLQKILVHQCLLQDTGNTLHVEVQVHVLLAEEVLDEVQVHEVLVDLVLEEVQVRGVPADIVQEGEIDIQQYQEYKDK